MALGPGTRLGTYEILTLLGSGGMGAVYRTRDTKLKRDVAIKSCPTSSHVIAANSLPYLDCYLCVANYQLC